ncbi:hypothetical protein Trydic_g3654 [Trypoxylus dichotomus]
MEYTRPMLHPISIYADNEISKTNHFPILIITKSGLFPLNPLFKRIKMNRAIIIRGTAIVAASLGCIMHSLPVSCNAESTSPNQSSLTRNDLRHFLLSEAPTPMWLFVDVEVSY